MRSTEEIDKGVKSVISRVLAKELSDLRSDTAIIDLDMDSLEAVSVCQELEEEFDVTIEPALLAESKTLINLVESINLLLNRPNE